MFFSDSSLACLIILAISFFALANLFSCSESLFFASSFSFSASSIWFLILLIASFLSDAQLKEFYEIAKELSLDVLIEVHDKSEMDRALKLEFPLIGINNRDLKTFKVNLETTIDLSKGLQDKIIVSESGIKTKEDVKEIMSSGTKTFLVGESFMRASDPGEELQKLFFS